MRRAAAFWFGLVIVIVSLVACVTTVPDEPIGRTTQGLDNAAPIVWPGAWYATKQLGVNIGDPTGDANGSRDVVGNAANPAVYIGSDAAHMYFRIRLGTDPRKTATSLDPFGWGCQLDTDGTVGTYEYFINVNGIINGDIVQLLQNTTKAVDDPADKSEVVLLNGVSNAAGGYTALQGSTVVNASPAHARVVAAGTAVGGGTDYFIDFALDKNDFPAPPATDGFNPETMAFRVFCGSSSNAQNLQSDLTSTSGATTLTGLASDPIYCPSTGCSTGCFVDSNCGGTEWCNKPSCVAKLTNGTSIPTVAGHNPVLNGACTAAVGTAICAAGVCDTTDNKCGYANGGGTCTAGNAATVCRGGGCSTTGKCMPAGGCLVDADCSSAQFCNTATNACVSKLTNGTAIPTIANHTPALTGACSAPVATAVCQSAVCDATTNECGYENNGGSCTPANAATVCQGGGCSTTSKCMPAGGCLVDADCGSTQFCNTQTLACVSKLTNGTSIPTIANHTPALTGTCSAPVGTSVCSAGVCDVSDNKCGYANGNGTCTVANAATVCRSGACAAGVCAAPAQCTTDANCAAGQFCDTQAGACVPKLPNNTAIPTITGHTPALTGACSVAVAQSVCTSQVCETSDNKCGYADGSGTCNAGNAATVCRSASCSTTNVCKPAGGCLVDADCTGAQFCNTATNLCVAKLPNDTAIPTIANHTPVLTGTCSAAVGTAVCAAAVCETADDKCGYANGSGPCNAGNAATVCRSGSCSATNVCKPAGGCAIDADCAANQFCNTATNLCVAKLPNDTAIPTIANHTPALAGTCNASVGAAVCTAAVCDVADNKCGYDIGTGPCNAVNAGTVCRSGACSITTSKCMPNGGCLADADCASNQFCDTAVRACTAKVLNGVNVPTIANHTPALTGLCTGPVATAVCASGVCDINDNKCGYANGNGTCTPANAGTVCRSGTCSPGGVCVAPAACAGDGDCAATQFCNTEAVLCASKLPNGTIVPTIANHTPVLIGTCNASVGTAVCLSGVCDVTDNLCGYANGNGTCTQQNAATVCRSGKCGANGVCVPAGSCSADSDCTAAEFCNTQTALCTAKLSNSVSIPTIANHTPALTGVCDAAVGTAVCAAGVCDTADHKCGFSDGNGACTAANAATVCRSGICTNGTCGTPSGCTSDASCTASQFCNTATNVCVAKLTNGTNVPTIANHDPALNGKCSAGVGASVCASGVCDTTDDKCGLGDGKGPCTQANEATVCRSKKCSSTGICETPTTPSGCTQDSDCTTGQFCNTQTKTCSSKLKNGDSIPTVSGHTPALEGKCTDAVGASVCASGVCDAQDDKCGYLDGHGTCNANNAQVVCRSGNCTGGGVCGLSTTAPDAGSSAGCTVDTDCPTGSYCDNASRACKPKLGNGEALPNVPGHNPPISGNCDPAVAAVVCASGVCDPVDNRCGFASGQGICSDSNAATVCRSKLCRNDGKCAYVDEGSLEGGGCNTSGGGSANGQGASVAVLVALGLMLRGRRKRAA